MPNAFDDLPPVGAVAAQGQPVKTGNAFDDLTPPPKLEEPKPALPDVTAKDRAHAAEGGILGGLAYTATAIPDAVANLYGLGKAGLGAAYTAATGKPGWDVGEPFPVGRALTGLMDKSDLLSTQAPRPDDTASRYLNTVGQVAGGVAGGQGAAALVGAPTATAAQLARSLAVAAPGAAAGRAVAEAKPFESDAANNAASILTQALGTRAVGGVLRPQGAPLPENQIKNDAVLSGQKLGYQFPPGTTNPTFGNVSRETIAGKTNVAQNMAVHNQSVTNEAARSDMGLPPGKGSAITDLEMETAKANAAPGYDALRNAGPINPPPTFGAQLDAALSKQSGAGRLSSKLADPELATIVGDLKQKAAAGPGAFTASDAMDTIDALRDKASAAYRTGNSQAGKAYKGVSNAIENAIDTDLSSRGGASADLVSNFRDSRQKFAIINSVDENRNAANGNVLAQKLAGALKKGDYLTGNLQTAGQAAAQAPAAFAEPTKTAGNHLGLWGSLGGGLLAAKEAHELLPESLQGLGMGTALAAGAVPLARAGTRLYIQGPGQKGALPRATVPILDPSVLGGSYAVGAQQTNR